MINGQDFDFKSNQIFLFDTNIWMFLFCPIGNYQSKRQAHISKFFERVLLAHNHQIVITYAVVSEFANAFLRLDYKLWKDQEKQYGAIFKKDFFETEHCKATRLTISNILSSKIFPITTRYPDSFNAIEIDKLLAHYKVLDFNDALFYYWCKRNKWNFVSDDTDFDFLGDVITIKP